MRQPDFTKGLLPAIIQDAHTLKVLMLGYMNQAAWDQTHTTGKVTFYSRSKERLWVKGESSQNFLHFKEAKIDCDEDAILITASPAGPTCHTGDDTCWQEKNENKVQFIKQLEGIIRDRKNSTAEKSYTKSLFDKGINKIAQKVGEEAVEIVIEAKDNNKELFLGEAADLLFHYLVLLEAKEIELNEVIDTLMDRHQPSAS